MFLYFPSQYLLSSIFYEDGGMSQNLWVIPTHLTSTQWKVCLMAYSSLHHNHNIQELRYSLRSRSARARPLSRPGSLSWGKVTAEWPLIWPGPAPCHWHSPDWHQCLTPRWEPDTGSLTKYLPSEIQEKTFSICSSRLCLRILQAKTILQPQEVLSTTE